MPSRKYIEKMFDGIAPSYDRLNHVMSLGVDKSWRRRSLKHVVDKSHPQRILDIACGTGDYSMAVAREMCPGGSLTAMDISEGMLGVMRRKLAARRFPVPVDVMVGDSEAMGFADGSFDVVTIAFGIRNFERRETALREISRVLRSGGRLVILELSTPRNKVLHAIYGLYFNKLMPLIGGRMSGDRVAYRYLPASVEAFPAPDTWMRTMRDCGFTDVRHRAYTLGLCRLYVGIKP